ncbi:MAG: NPCBM/NEW2 domain-containing protein [Planctomycetes bacterium]|nr:NPCBM/NEW2 domain-containing protein [Planctomycetota bacterium]
MNPVEDNTAVIAEIRSLAEAVCTESITPEQCGRLNSLLLDEKAALTYAVYLRMHGLLCWRWQNQIVIIETPETPPPVQLPAGLLGGAWQGTVGFFSQTKPFSYLAATVILGVTLLVFWAIKVTHHQHFATAPSKSVPSDARPERVFVGRITGLVDVKWSDDPRFLPPMGFAYVPLGRKYKLDAGLMQITYDSGAKVILEGPCTYEVESTSGGYLALGKLTAKVEKERSEVRSQRSEVRSQRSDHYPLSTSHQPLATNSNPQSLIPNPLFAIRTPTALVTDLGTEFGVEVDEAGVTESHVFRGKVVLVALGDDGKGRGREVTLGENESARVEKPTGGGNPVIVVRPGLVKPESSAFVRRLVRPPKVLDLLDIVAGGNGMGRCRERGIDPSTGMEDPVFIGQERTAGRQFRPVVWHKLIDGVFMPDGKAGPVQLDSAGHTFAGFPATDGRVFGSIWARAAELRPDDRRAEITNNWVYAMGPGEQFTPKHRGLLGLSPNVGVTFDLEAMRRAHPGVTPSRFRAVAGLGDPDRLVASDDGLVDLWVFADGRLKFKRIGLRRLDGTVKVDVELGPGDRFLTLAVTDGGDEIVSDWFVLGDPVLELVPTTAENQEGGQTMNGP